MLSMTEQTEKIEQTEQTRNPVWDLLSNYLFQEAEKRRIKVGTYVNDAYEAFIRYLWRIDDEGKSSLGSDECLGMSSHEKMLRRIDIYLESL